MTDHAPKFALIGHPLDMPLFRAYINFLKPGKAFKDELLLKLFEWTPSYTARSWTGLTFDGAKFMDGILIMVPFLPEMRDISLRSIIEKVEKAIAIAAAEGCAAAALGAFTSIVLQGKEEELAKRYGIALTSGNTTTAALIVRSLEELAAHRSGGLSGRTVAVIGASGDIGAGVTLWLGDKVKKMILSARNRALLDNFVAKNRHEFSCAVEITTDNGDAIKKADVVVFVTSAYQPLFGVGDFNADSIVCDASAPLNVRLDGERRPDMFLYHGGIARLPVAVDPGFDLGLAAPDHLYGCMTEGILMTLNPDLPPSLGRGNITKEKIQVYSKELDRYHIPPAYSCGKEVLTLQENADT
jgi:fatty aldehyde-generating acyl-ACP reductase